MKDTPLSICEKAFILQCIREQKRLDGRKLQEFRPVKINFGTELGSVHVTLGETRVLGKTSCELGTPKITRPNEGILHINVELSPMAAVNFEAGRNSELSVQINRILERTFKDSRCVYLESLCVTAEDKVWMLRVDLTVLNHEGNLIDCASIAALAAIAHFKRPDVTVSGEEIKIHTFSQKDPIPIVLSHYPVCISYAIFQDGEIAVADPTLTEEQASEASMVFGLNSYRELCCLNLGGTTHTSTNLLLHCSNEAANRAKTVVEQIKAALEKDSEARSQREVVGFSECLRLQKITSLAEDKLRLKLPHFQLNIPYEPNFKYENDSDAEQMKVENVAKNTSILNSNQVHIRWVDENESSEDDFFSDYQDEEKTLEHQLEDITENMSQRMNQPISKVVASTSNIQDTSSDSEGSSEHQSTNQVLARKLKGIEINQKLSPSVSKVVKSETNVTEDSSSDSEEESTIILG